MGHYNAIFEGMVIKDSTIVTSGVISDSLPRAPAKNQIGFFDLNGDLLYWKKYRGDPALNYGTFYNSFIATSDGGYAVTGYAQDTLGAMKVLFMKFDSIGDTVFVKQYDDGDTTCNFRNSEALIEWNNGYLIGGTKQVRVTQSSHNTDVQLIKIDYSGNIEWWKTYGVPSFTDSYISLAEWTDTSCLIGYVRSTWDKGVPQDQESTHLMLIDTLGSVITEWQDPCDSTGWAKGLTKTKDGGIAYCGMKKATSILPGPIVDFYGSVTKLDSSYNLLWRRSIGYPSSETFFYTLKELVNGDLIVAGEHLQYGDSVTMELCCKSSGWFAKFSSTGDSIWDRKYRLVEDNDATNEIYDIEILQNGEIIGCGQTVDRRLLINKAQGWLIRLDSMGCLIPGCDTLTATDIKEHQNDAIGIRIFPNPANEMVYVLLKSEQVVTDLSFSVYDLTGRLITEVREAQKDITYLLNTASYAKGSYLVVVSNGKTLTTGRFVKE